MHLRTKVKPIAHLKIFPIPGACRSTEEPLTAGLAVEKASKNLDFKEILVTVYPAEQCPSFKCLNGMLWGIERFNSLKQNNKKTLKEWFQGSKVAKQAHSLHFAAVICQVLFGFKDL